MVDDSAVRGSIEQFAPDLVVHCAIMNDWHRMYADRDASWAAYVGATRSTAKAALDDAGAAYVLVSTDWVFDGTQGGAHEETPPNPINLYGTLKLASEMVTLESGGAVARVSGVNGMHVARPQTPRSQDRGFGYFVASLVDALGSGRPFTVWEGDDINMIATPSLALECGEIMIQIGERRLGGVFHCCGADAVTRRELARTRSRRLRSRREPAALRTARSRIGCCRRQSRSTPHSAHRAPIVCSADVPLPVRALLERFKSAISRRDFHPDRSRRDFHPDRSRRDFHPDRSRRDFHPD